MKLKIFLLLVLYAIQSVLSDANKTESDNSVFVTSNVSLFSRDEQHDNSSLFSEEVANKLQLAIKNHLDKLNDSSSAESAIKNHLEKLKNSSSVVLKNDTNSKISNKIKLAISSHLEKLLNNTSVVDENKKVEEKPIITTTKPKINTKKNGSKKKKKPTVTKPSKKKKRKAAGKKKKPSGKNVNAKEIKLGKAQNKAAKAKKQDLMSRILPMMIIPFMLQTAIIPIVLTGLKMALMKSALIGKLAILIGLLNMFRIASTPGGVYTHNINVEHDHHPMSKEVAHSYYGYNGDEEYGAYVNRRKKSLNVR